jgi:multiple antibiotic resistance protein
MEEALRFLPHTFIPLFVAMDAFAVMAIFLGLTQGMPRAKVRKVLRDSIVTALGVSLGFLAIGEGVFALLGITANDFKVAGGLVLLIFAVLDLVRAGERRRYPVGTMGVVPLGVPLIVGPAVLTTLLVLTEHYGLAPTVLSLALNLALVWLAMRNAQVVVRFFGRGGITALSKLMALLLASIAVMMIRLGLEGFLR